MSVTIKLKGTNVTETFEAELTVPSQNIGAATADPESNRSSISKFTNQFIDDVNLQLDNSLLSPECSSSASAIGDTEMANGGSSSATIQPAPAIDAKEAGDDRIRVRIIMPWSTVIELKVSPKIDIGHLKEIYARKPGGTSIQCLSIVYGGRARAHSLTLQDLGVKDGDAIYAS